MPLSIDPAAATVPATGGVSIHTLTNSEASKIVYKIKSSNFKEYRVQPNSGFIDAGATAQLKILRLAGPPKGDSIVIQFAIAPNGATDAQQTFKRVTVTRDVTLLVMAEESENVVAVEEPHVEEMTDELDSDSGSEDTTVNCRMCHSMIQLEGRRMQRVVKCDSCQEVTAIRPAGAGKKYVRCSCKCLIICNASSTRIQCPRQNCRRVITLGEELEVTEEELRKGMKALRDENEGLERRLEQNGMQTTVLRRRMEILEEENGELKKEMRGMKRKMEENGEMMGRKYRRVLMMLGRCEEESERRNERIREEIEDEMRRKMKRMEEEKIEMEKKYKRLVFGLEE